MNGMNDPFQFSELVEKYVKQSGYSYQQVADLAGLANKTTISNWINGGVKRPRDWRDLLRVAKVLELGESETAELLLAAGQPSLNTLRDNTTNPKDQTLLNHWFPPKRQSTPPIISQSPFQVPREDVTQFIGRDEEKKQIEQVLCYGDKLCVLQGMGGVGKSALAIHMAYQLRPYFPDGVLWARVTNQDSLLSILHTIANTYHRDVHEYLDLESLSRVVREILVNKQVLLVLDNIQNSEDLEVLLPPVGQCAVLITTRNQRAIGERKAISISLEPFQQEAGLSLLTSIIGAERLAKEMEAAQQIIQFVGGLPLALRVIASTLAHTSYLTIEEYRRWLFNEPEPLENLSDWENTHQNVRASFEISYKLLPQPLQSLFASFSVFDGPDFSAEAIHNNARLPKVQIKMHMGRLCALSLVEASMMAEKESRSILRFASTHHTIAERYRLHPLLKLFAREKLGHEFTNHRYSIAAYFARFAYQNRLYHDLLKLDLENVLAALHWASEQQQWQILVEGVLGLTWIQGGVVGFMDARGHWYKAREILGWALSGVATLNNPLLEAGLLASFGAFAVRQADFEVAHPHLQKALNILDHLPLSSESQMVRSQICDFMSQLMIRTDRQVAFEWAIKGIESLQGVETEDAHYQEGYLHILLASLFGRLGDLDKAIQTAEIGLSLLPPIPSSAQVKGYIVLANVSYTRGDWVKSISHLEQGIVIAQELHDLRQQATLLLNLSNNYERQGNFSSAISRSQKALQLYQQMGDVFYEGGVQSNLAKFHFRLGNNDEMFDYLRKARDIARIYELDEVEGFAKSVWSEWCIANGRFQEAETTLIRVKEICERLHINHLLPTVIRLQAEVALYQGKQETASQHIAQAMQQAAGQQDVVEEGICWRIKGQLMAGSQQTQAVVAAFQQSLSHLVDRDVFEWARSKMELAKYHQAYQKEMDKDQIIGVLQEAIAVFTQLDTKRELEETGVLLRQLRG